MKRTIYETFSKRELLFYSFFFQEVSTTTQGNAEVSSPPRLTRVNLQLPGFSSHLYLWTKSLALFFVAVWVIDHLSVDTAAIFDLLMLKLSTSS